MLTQFDTLSDQSRVWIYQANRKITDSEQLQVLRAAESFIEQWAAHGQQLYASAVIKYDQFLIIATDEAFNLASGCSIDASVHFVQDLSSRLEIDFFDRTQLAFLINNEVQLFPMKAIKLHIANKDIDDTSLFFQNTVQGKAELQHGWCVKAGESWLKRYFIAEQSV